MTVLCVVSLLIVQLFADSIISNISDLTMLNSQFSSHGSGTLQPCSINTYTDKTSVDNLPYNYLFLPLSSSNSTYSFLSNIYNSKVQQYDNPNNPSLSSILPTEETSDFYSNGYLQRSVSSCISPKTLDIIICYQQPENEYNISIQCNIFHNNKSSQIWTKSIKASEYFFQETFTNVVCFENSYLILWADFTYFEDSWVRYSILDLNANMLTYNQPLSLGNITHSFCWGFINAVSSPFRNKQNGNQIFLLEVIDESQTQYAVGMIGEYNESSIDNDTITFNNIPEYQYIDDDISGLSLYYGMTVIQQNDQCCFLIPYTDNNNTYVSIMDIYGNKVLTNDTLIVSGYDNLWIDIIDLYNGYWMIIYDSFDKQQDFVILYGNIYSLSNQDGGNKYNLETIAIGIQLQKWLRKECLFCANTISINNQTEIFVASLTGTQIASKADIYAQTFKFSPP